MNKPGVGVSRGSEDCSPQEHTAGITCGKILHLSFPLLQGSRNMSVWAQDWHCLLLSRWAWGGTTSLWTVFFFHAGLKSPPRTEPPCSKVDLSYLCFQEHHTFDVFSLSKAFGKNTHSVSSFHSQSD